MLRDSASKWRLRDSDHEGYGFCIASNHSLAASRLRAVFGVGASPAGCHEPLPLWRARESLLDCRLGTHYRFGGAAEFTVALLPGVLTCRTQTVHRWVNPLWAPQAGAWPQLTRVESGAVVHLRRH